jgi:hypothetical protein
MRKGKLYEGNAMILEHFQNAQLEDGTPVCEACLFEKITSSIKSTSQNSGIYDGSQVMLNKPLKGKIRRYKIYLEDPRSSQVRRVDFGSDSLSSKEKPRRFKTTHRCGDPRDPKTHWSCLE